MSERPALVTVHGFMGNGRIFDALLPAGLEARYERFDITLAGHGCTIDEFSAHGSHDWQASVNTVLHKLRREEREVFLVTHSMGGLLAILFCLEQTEGISGIISLALPLKLKLSAKALFMRLRAVLPSKTNDDKAIEACREMCGVTGLTLFNSVRLIPNSFALLRLSARVRRKINALRVPLCVINSDSDEIVCASSSDFLRRALPCAVQHRLKRSLHFLYTDDESSGIRALIADRLL